MSSKPLWSSIKIQVPSEFITISPKTGKVSIKPPLTKVSKSISKVNKKPAIEIVEGDKLKIIDEGKYDEYNPIIKKAKVKQTPIKQEEPKKPKRENKVISGGKTIFKLSEPSKVNIKEDIKPIKGKLTETHKIEAVSNEALIDVDNILKYLTVSGKQHFKTEEQKNNFDKIVNAIKAYDFYPTPTQYGDQIYKDVREWFGSDKIIVLDIACGLLSLSMNFIKNGDKVLLNEYNPTFGSIIKPLENSKVSITIDDFFDLKPNYYYNKNINVIVMNPPFSVPIDYKSYKLGYLLFLLKGLDILEQQKSRDRKFLYIICPLTYFKISGHIAELHIPMESYKKAIKLFSLEDYGEDGASIYDIEFLGYVSGFKTIKNGKPHLMNQKFGLFKFMA